MTAVHNTNRQFLFLLGRPGSGKSRVYNELAHLLGTSPLRQDDYPRLKSLADSDDAEEVAGRPRQFTKKVDGRWLATQVAYETVLRDIDTCLRQKTKADGLVFVEFARADMVRSIEDNFSREVLDRSFLIYIYCPLSICIERNRSRRKDTPTSADDHEVPPDRLTLGFRDDDHDDLDQLGVPYILIDNHLDGTANLKLEAAKILEALRSS